ncbi:Alkaline phosphatase synthesis transcriptional regulatory protein SphR [Enhygromyxa salina]|uniref:Alkaline phosphatase synthesis transcriptional regulatory protein SphR n=1 Tax=Enhygromyxa salina TaxID=215803 RepID=A0A2S9YG48_9BACT|nr:response regulator [Enhygromyxa salina]PRQ04080.1 Alkaline phosphatase synthesis transcriptional regulatory protein SphR [Enhygromyxa salina]
MPGPPSAKPPIFKIGFESYDDFLVEYGDHLRKGVLMLPGETGLGPGQDVRIKLVLPNEKVLYIKGTTREQTSGTYATLGSKANTDEIQVQLVGFSAEQTQALESCVSGAISTEPAQAAEPEATGPINLLLVDDSVGVRIELGDALRDRGLRVRVAENGLVAIAAALKRPPDIILSDVEMPVMDGWTFLRMTRARQRLSHIPFVFFTRLTDDLSRLQAYRMGVEDFLSKDTGPEEVLARLQGVLARHQNRPSAAAAAAASQAQGLRGDLVHVKLGSLMSFLESEKRSGRLLLDNGQDQAVLEIVNGALSGVENLGNYAHAHDRVFELLDWPNGSFEFAQADEHDMPAPAGDPTPMTYLLMEHARRADEAAEAANTDS